MGQDTHLCPERVLSVLKSLVETERTLASRVVGKKKLPPFCKSKYVV